MGQAGAPPTQIHDYEPGIQPNGVFWTIALPDSVLSHDLARGTASFKLDNYPIRDWINFEQSLLQLTSTPAVVSFDLRWSQPDKRYTVSKSEQTFVYDFTFTKSTITWTAEQDTFSFVSDPADPSKSVYASVGHERNGIFFAAPAAATTTTTSTTSPRSTQGVSTQRRSLPATGRTDRRAAIAGVAALGVAAVLRRARVAVDEQPRPPSNWI